MIDAPDKYSLYRGLTMTLAIFLIAMALGNFHRYSTSTTDENLFTTAPSRLYFTRSVVANAAGQTFGANRASVPDSVKAGDLLVSVAGKKTRSLSELRQAIKELPAGAAARIRIFRPAQGKRHRMLISAAALTDGLVTELSGAVHVSSITPGGASDLADLRVGDLIVRINGETFNTAKGADLILRRAQSGSTILYDIVRSGKQIVLPVTLAKWGFQITTFLSFLTGMAFWAIGAFLAVKRSRIKAALLLGIMFMLFGFVIMNLLTQRDVGFDLFARVRTVSFLGAIFFGLAILPHSRLTFPLEQPDLPVRRWYIALPYCLAAVFLLVTASMILTSLGAGGGAFNFVLAGATMWLILHAIYVRFRLRKTHSARYRKLARWLNWSVVIAFALATLTTFLILNFGRPDLLGIVPLNLLIIPLIFLYTIGRYQLLEMNLRVRRNVQYSIISTLWSIGLIAGLIWLLTLLPGLYMDIPNIHFTGTTFIVLDLPPDATVHEFWERLAIIFIALALAWLTRRIRKAGQRQIDRLFNREAYNLSHATSELAEIMATRLGMDDLAKGIIEKLAKLMELKRVGVIFFRNEKERCCQQAYGFDGAEWDNLCLSASGRLITEIKRFRSESRFSIDYLPDEIKEVFLTEGFRHIIPIRFKNRLVGTFIIGEKLSESPIHLEDLTFLSAVAKQASIAIENAFLHEELTEQERLKHELHIARRIQMASLPQTTPRIAGLEISGTSIPAREVGGDYFDYLNGEDEGLTIIVGDVSGKGTSAALYMSKVQGIIRSLHAFNLSPRELFVRANNLLCDDMEKKSFITALAACIDTAKRRLVLARAGHLPLFYYHAKSRAVSLVTPKGLGLGLGMNNDNIFEREIEETELDYSSGDIFLFVTDGVTEAQTASGGEFGEDKLSELLRSSAALSAVELRDRVISEVKHFEEDQLPHDDQTVVVVKIR